jgi:hypothetical protein
MARPPQPRAQTQGNKKLLHRLIRAAGGREQLKIWIDQVDTIPGAHRPRKDRAALVDTGSATPDGNLRRLELTVDGWVVGVLFFTRDQLAKKKILAGQRGQPNPAKTLTKMRPCIRR